GVDNFRRLFAGKFGESLGNLETKEKRPYHPFLYVEVLRAFCTFVNGDEALAPLTVIGVRRGGLPTHEGIYDDDIIVKVNDIPVKGMKLREVQMMVRKSGRFVKVLVKDSNDDALNEQLRNQNRRKAACDWESVFPWNDVEKPIYHESNCYMVPSQAMERMMRAHELAMVIEEQRQEAELRRIAEIMRQGEKEKQDAEAAAEDTIIESPPPEFIRLDEVFETIFYLQKREPCSCEHVTYLVYKIQLPEGSEDISEKLIKKHVQFAE
uniref:PDZ domain-containing protein n=1 Tax=Lutzomyia longipalpis TaxID=7200 RepID=A0A1B0CBR1_LUTLO